LPYSCRHCGQQFPTAIQLAGHVRRAHSTGKSSLAQRIARLEEAVFGRTAPSNPTPEPPTIPSDGTPVTPEMKSRKVEVERISAAKQTFIKYRDPQTGKVWLEIQ